MYEFWYDYIKSKYQNNAKLCYLDTDSFIIHIKSEDVYEDIADDVEKRFKIAYRKNKKLIGLMKDELGGKIVTEFVVLRPKTYSYLMDDCNSDTYASKVPKKATGTKKTCNTNT